MLLLDLCSLYSISIVHGTAVIGENCTVQPVIVRYIRCCRKFTVKCCMLVGNVKQIDRALQFVSFNGHIQAVSVKLSRG